MPDTREAWIAESIELDGVPASIKSIRHRSSVDVVTDYYRRAWTRYGRVQVSREEGRTVIATLHRDRFISLQLEAGDEGSYGVLIVSEVPVPGLRKDVSLALPPGFIVLSTQTHRDGGKLTETLTLQSDGNVSVTTASLATRWRTDGWTVLSDMPASTIDGGRRLDLRRDAERLTVFIAQDERWDGVTLAFVVRQRTG